MPIYTGKFYGIDGEKYKVTISKDVQEGEEEKEIILSDNSPFVVTYNTSDTPFDPVRTSTAQINVVHNDYMTDILSNNAHGTVVQLLKATNPNSESYNLVWTGYLTPKIFDAGYEDCFETFQLEAADCISSLQYYDYVPTNNKGIVSFWDIIVQMMGKMPQLRYFAWCNQKSIQRGQYVTTVKPELLSISEKNFFSSDTEEPWKLSEVLEEMCRYIGLTCFQDGNTMHFFDYQRLGYQERPYWVVYDRNSSFATGGQSTRPTQGNVTITAADYRLNGATISFEPVYNKVCVKANMYAIERFLPNIFDDALLTNRNGDFYASVDVPPVSGTPSYPGGSVFLGIGQDYDEEPHKEPGDKDTDYVFRYRIYDNQYWESVYSDQGGSEHFITDTGITASSAVTTHYRGGTIIDLGVVQDPYRNQGQQLIIPSKMDYTRYLCISQKHNNNQTGKDTRVFKLKDGFSAGIVPVEDCFVVINFTMLLEKYLDRPYINPKWSNTAITKRWTKSGSFHNSIGSPRFKFKIGNKYWNGSEWTTTDSEFTIEAEWDKERKMFAHEAEDFWNSELQVLNNISWEDELNATGYKIPLSGVNYAQEVSFEIINPEASVHGNTGNPKFEEYFWDYNAFCWIKDLSIDFYRKEHEDKEENDIVYENVIDSGSTCEMSDITCKITSDNPLAQPSYSTVAYKTGTNAVEVWPLTKVKEQAIGNVYQLPEKNIIEKYVRQYQTPTEKITFTTRLDIKPWARILGLDVDYPNKVFVQLGTEIDYHNSRQTMTCIEKKS